MDRWIVDHFFLVHPANRNFIKLGEVSGFAFPLTSTRSMFSLPILGVFGTLILISLGTPPLPPFMQGIAAPIWLILLYFALVGFSVLKDYFYATFGKPIDATLHTVEIRYQGKYRGYRGGILHGLHGWKMDVHFEFLTPQGERLEKIEVLPFHDFEHLSSTLTPELVGNEFLSPLGVDDQKQKMVQYAFNKLLREHHPKVRVQYVNINFFRAL